MINCNTTNEKPQTKDSPSCNNLLVYIKGQTYPEKNQSQAAPVNPNLKQPTMKFLVTHLNLFTHCIFASTEDIHSIDLSLKKKATPIPWVPFRSHLTPSSRRPRKPNESPNAGHSVKFCSSFIILLSRHVLALRTVKYSSFGN